MAAYAALVSLLNNIHQITNHPRFSTSLDNRNIQPLLEKIGFLLDFIEGYKYVGSSKEAEHLERKIASAAHAAEDFIESHIVDQIHEANRIWPKLLTFLLKCVGCHISERPEEPLDLHVINEAMDAIMKEAKEYKERQRSGDELQASHLTETRVQSGESAMVGLDAELNQLLDELTGYQSSRRVVSVVGMGGTGKTTLAKSVYENLLIKEQFQFRAWATISQQINAKEVLSKLLGLGGLSNATVDDLGLQLHKTLSGRRYLIILDDIWSVKAWDEVKRFFPDNSNRSRILLTTRLSNVAKDCSSSLFMMNLLDEKSSWKLFCKKTFQDGHCPRELLEVGKKIVKLCKGLALSIVVIGGLLRKSPNRTLGYWSGVAKDLESIPTSKEKQQSLDVLSLSYNHLPHHLKPCFLYMGVFKEDSEVRVSRIIKLWVAEGFLKPTGSRVLEDIAEDYIKDLIDRNLILVSKRRKNGKVGSCSIHDLLRDLCIRLAEQEEFFRVCKGRIQGTERRLAYSWYINLWGVRRSLARSIIAQGTYEPLSVFRLLRVLDEVGYAIHADYYKNVNLRYLAFIPKSSVGPLWKLPSSISHIWNLQTLIIRDTFGILAIVPIEFWTMRQLRHVECNKLYIPSPPLSNREDELFQNLQTLTSAVNFKLCEEVCNIIPNIKKLHLVYDSGLRGYDDNLIECLRNLDRLHKLETLSLENRFTTSFPGSLKKLSLKQCEFKWDDMTIIGSLPQLEVLKLEFLHVSLREEWSPVDGHFRHLKYLKIEYCNLFRWHAENSHFPVLEKLHLKNLRNLEEVPLDIGDIPTLELLRVECCSNSAAISAVKIKEDQLENGGQLQVQVRVYDWYMESFNQMLETEGLTIDNIHFEMY